MVTGDASATTVREAIAKGATGYIVKPFDAAKMVDAIERTVKAVQSKLPGSSEN